MTKMNTTIRFSPEKRDEILNYAKKHTNSSFSSAVRQLIEIGLDRAFVIEDTKAEMQAIVNKQIERLAKVSSRGTKASLSTLVLVASLFPTLHQLSSDELSQISLLAEKSGVQLSPPNNASSERWAFQSPSDLFDFAWQAGGRLQVSGQKPNYEIAVEDLLKSKQNFADQPIDSQMGW